MQKSQHGATLAGSPCHPTLGRAARTHRGPQSDPEQEAMSLPAAAFDASRAQRPIQGSSFVPRTKCRGFRPSCRGRAISEAPLSCFMAPHASVGERQRSNLCKRLMCLTSSSFGATLASCNMEFRLVSSLPRKVFCPTWRLLCSSFLGYELFSHWGL